MMEGTPVDTRQGSSASEALVRARAPGLEQREDRKDRSRRRRRRVERAVVETPRRWAGRGKHVVILVENLPVPFDRRPWQIAQTLVAQGCRVSVVCPRMYDWRRGRERLEGIDIYRYPNREGSTPLGWAVEYLNAIFWMSLISVWLMLTRGIDAIHACNPPDVLFAVAWPFKVFFGVKFLFDHHDLNPEVYLAKFGRAGRMHRVLCGLEKMTYQLADVAMVTNESFKQIAMRRDGKRSDRVYVVRNAPMAGRLVKGRARAELRFGRKHLVVYLGVMNRQDGVDGLLDSIDYVLRRREDVAFALIGDGPELPGLRRRAEELGFDGQVRFVGRISEGAVLSDYLNTATLCVCPDPKNEMNDRSTMTKVVEYMALGKPIVAYDLKETVYSAADAAVYARNNDWREFGELIVQLLEDPRRRRTMSLRGQARYERLLSWRHSQKQIVAAYGRLFCESGADGAKEPIGSRNRKRVRGRVARGKTDKNVCPTKTAAKAAPTKD